jgi:hypothetical protein
LTVDSRCLLRHPDRVDVAIATAALRERQAQAIHRAELLQVARTLREAGR